MTPENAPEDDRLEFRLEGEPVTQGEWLKIQFGSVTKYGTFGGIDPEKNTPILVVYRDGKPSGTLTFPAEATKVFRSTEQEVKSSSIIEKGKLHSEHVDVVLEKIKAAQNLLTEACQELSPVPDFADEWSTAGEVQGKIRHFWHQIHDRRSQRKSFALVTIQAGQDIFLPVGPCILVTRSKSISVKAGSRFALSGRIPLTIFQNFISLTVG